MKRIAIRLLTLCLLATVLCLPASALAPVENSYTYANDKTAIPAPTAYHMAQSLPVDAEIADVAVYDNRLYILQKNGVIAVFGADSARVATLGEGLGLSEPEGFYISPAGDIYVADTGNGRILKLANDGSLRAAIGAPDPAKTLSQTPYLPSKVVVDAGERLYVIVNNETNGIYQLDPQGSFLGFFGSVPVVPSLTELMWRAISTKEQLARMLLFVPTEYSSMDIDATGFLYTTVSTSTDAEIESYIASGGTSSNLAPVRRLNPKNIDVLVRTGSMPPAGDYIRSGISADSKGNASRFVDVSVQETGRYCVLDSTRGRVFTYDNVGNLLYLFGNLGDAKDEFVEPTALSWWGDRIAVADRGVGSVKIFEPTEYALLVNQAVDAEHRGDYDTAGDCWNRLLEIHSGSDLAYVGLGKQAMRAGDYRAAMRWFRRADSTEDYSKALKSYRQKIGYALTGTVLVGAVVLAIAVFVVKRVRRRKRPAATAERRGKHPVLEGVRYGFYIMRHPFDGYWDMQHENRGNLRAATCILLGVLLCNLMRSFCTGYLVSGNRDADFNVLVQGILSVLLPFALWCVANWSVTSLMDGSGSFAAIYEYSCYALTPMLIGLPLLTVLSNLLSLDEVTLYGIVQTLVYIWLGFLLFCGTLVVHQYTPMRTTATILLIILAMGILIFLALLCTTIVQQMTDFLGLLMEEINLRM